MSVILSMETFKKLEEKIGTEPAKQVYEIAEAIFEEVSKKNEQKIDNYKLDFADDEYKRLSRKELNEFKEQLLSDQRNTKDEIKMDFYNSVKKMYLSVWVLFGISVINLFGILWLLNNIIGCF